MTSGNLLDMVTLGEIFDYNSCLKVTNNHDEKVFDKALALLSKLNDEEKLLVYELFEEFLVITDYEPYAKMIARNLRSRYGKNDKIALVPITDDKGGVKSSHSMIYEVQRFIEFAPLKELLRVDSYKNLLENHEQYQIILIDDFIGSGSQARKIIRKMQASGIDIARKVEIQVVCIQEIALHRIRNLCPSVIFYNIRRRALTDNFAIKSFDRVRAARIYSAIESSLSMRPYYKFGYSRTESLVSMKRTPNNTLPIFWCMKAKGGSEWPAIFPRKE